jgi:peptidoglycan/LPS O-acetylase OafA/YrhL
MRGRSNALGLIRLLLAAAVILSHAFPLSGRPYDPFGNLSLQQDNLGGFAVMGFFGISGYLITKSGMSTGFLEYVWRRAIRIFPAFWTVLLVAAVIVGPMIWLVEGRELSSYFTLAPGGPLAYFTSNWTLTIQQLGIHDIFASTTPFGQTIGVSIFNGSLWTLRYEWACYLLIGVFVAVGVLSRARLIVPILTGFFLILAVVSELAPDDLSLVVPWLADQDTISFTLVFLWGATFAVYGHRIPIDDRIGVFAVALASYTVFNGGFVLIGLPAFTYGLLWLAIRLPPLVQRIGSRNDYSYGIYLYGFLVQQVGAYFGWYHLGFPLYVGLSLVIATACAILSWHLVEKPALRLKDWGPGRGLGYWAGRARGALPRRSHRPNSLTPTKATPVEE